MLGALFSENNIKLPSKLDSDYEYICELWKKKYFSFQQTRSVLTQFTQEALVQTLSLPKTEYRLDPNNKLSHLFLNLNLDQAVAPIEKKVNYWWELRSEINSPFQRPLVQNIRKLEGALTKINPHTSEDFWKVFQHNLKNLNCLYDIASATKLSTLQVAIAMRNLIKAGDITMLPYQEIAINNDPLVVSVDEHQTHQHVVKHLLEKAGYRVNTITDPFKALASLQGQSPDLILINADMEKMDGYQLAFLCRKSPQLHQVPIVLVVKNQTVVHNIKAKFSGVNDNLQNPFLPQGLLSKVKTNLGVTTSA